MNLGFVPTLRLTLWLHAASSVVSQGDGDHAKGVCLASERELQWAGVDLRSDGVCGPQHHLRRHLGLPASNFDQQVGLVMQKKALRVRQM